MLEDKSKKVPEGVEEIDEEELDLVAGGAYTKEEWTAMTPEERRAATLRSIKNKSAGTTCELD